MVEPGAALVVSVFDLAGGTMKVFKVALAASDMPQGYACPTLCDEGPSAIPPGALFPTITHQKVIVTNGVAWAMSDNDDMKLISVPGAYRFELSDDMLVGETHVEARLVRGGSVPAVVFFGSSGEPA
ncbi:MULTISPECIES: hypothetical protein [unclassified Paraburkholderia]|uniref:hypothetical protein n=1 Tax=unclassified Paraburkholderia TaxID=2615204 RepID=UPI001052C349|nr:MULTISPECIES: hypothetical protein [unclassified Paraburkholderia]